MERKAERPDPPWKLITESVRFLIFRNDGNVCGWRVWKRGYFYLKFLNEQFFTGGRSVISRSVAHFRVWALCPGDVYGKHGINMDNTERDETDSPPFVSNLSHPVNVSNLF